MRKFISPLRSIYDNFFERMMNDYAWYFVAVNLVSSNNYATNKKYQMTHELFINTTSMTTLKWFLMTRPLSLSFSASWELFRGNNI